MAEGNQNLLADVYRQHRQGLFTLALSITRSREAAEDAIQNVFERLCRRGFAADDPAAYVFAAVRNAARDLATRRTTISEVPLDLFDTGVTPEDTAQQNDTASLVQRCLQELDEQHRDVVVMKLWSDLTFAQIAAITGEPLQTVASRYRRSLQRMKELIGTSV